jgi:hypothetical protein
MADKRTLEKTNTPGVYRRHNGGCEGGRRCRCPYIVRWKAPDGDHKQLFDTYALAKEFKGTLASGKTTRKPQSAKSIRDYGVVPELSRPHGARPEREHAAGVRGELQTSHPPAADCPDQDARRDPARRAGMVRNR